MKSSESSILKHVSDSLELKPDDHAKQSDKKRYSERLSELLAYAFAEILRRRGLKEARPVPSGIRSDSGAERRMAGGIGAKKVDVTWATEESGLMLAISVKSINFRDKRTGNFQKNLVNRRGDLLMEAVTLHRRFPYAVLAGVFVFDIGATSDGTVMRESTFHNAHSRFKLFTGRLDPAGRDEQFEKLFIATFDCKSEHPFCFYEVGFPDVQTDVTEVITQLLQIVETRNDDLYELKSYQLKRRGSAKEKGTQPDSLDFDDFENVDS